MVTSNNEKYSLSTERSKERLQPQDHPKDVHMAAYWENSQLENDKRVEPTCVACLKIRISLRKCTALSSAMGHPVTTFTALPPGGKSHRNAQQLIA